MLKNFSVAYDAAMKKLNKVVGAISVTILSAIFLMMSVEILSRSMLQVSYAWSMELSRFGLVFVIFFGGSMLFHESGHIAVTLFHNLMSPKVLEITKSIFDIIVLYVLIMYALYSYEFALAGMHSPSVTRMMTMIYPRMAIPIGFLLMFLQVFNNLLKRFVKFQEYTQEQWDAEKARKTDLILKEIAEEESAGDAD
jgi:TRAP-type C4-dicarboxylate transport system permease small subunit